MATDKLFYQHAVQYPASILKLFGVIEGKNYQARSYTVKAIEKRPDLVFESEDKGQPIIYMDVQGYSEEFFYYRFLTGILIYCREKYYQGDLLPAVIFLNESFAQSVLNIRLQLADEKFIIFQPRVFTFSPDKYEELEKLQDIHLIPFYPLCGFTKDELMDKTTQWVERIKNAQQLSKEEQINLITLLGGFVGHCIKSLNLEKLNILLGDFKMEDTQVGKDLIEIGILKERKESQENIRKALKESQKAIKEAHIEGHKEGREDGFIEAYRQMIYNFIVKKFGEVSALIQSRLPLIEDLDKLIWIQNRLFEVKEKDQLEDLFNGQSDKR